MRSLREGRCRGRPQSELLVAAYHHLARLQYVFVCVQVGKKREEAPYKKLPESDIVDVLDSICETEGMICTK